MYTSTLKKNEEKNILNGFPWVYANEVASIEGKDKQGSVAKVLSSTGRYVGMGFINHHSKILVRMLTLKNETIDREFFRERIRQAIDQRFELGYENSCRLIFAESDFLPGLIVDKYGDLLSVQFLCLGMEVIREDIISILVELLNPRGIYERSDVAVREKEGLKLKKGVIYGDFDPETIIHENGLDIIVNLEEGQKTGYFLDQQANRDNLSHYAKGKEVLDCFCNEGGFSLCAKKYGAKSVLAVDISEKAIDLVKRNAALNNLEIDTKVGDVFKVLRDFRAEGRTFDLIVLDPPAFIKSVDTVKSGFLGYKDININALKLIRKGGYLVTCSCSQHLTVALFFNMLKEALSASGIRAKLIEFRTQGKDHASLISYDEGLYLKVAVLKIIE